MTESAPQPTPQRIDLAIAFYRGQKWWSIIARSIQENTEAIDRVIVVADEPWDAYGDWRPEVPGHELVLADFPDHPYFGLSRVKNRGAQLCEGAYYMQIDQDVYLPEGSVAAMLAEAAPERLVFPGEIIERQLDQGLILPYRGDLDIRRHGGIRRRTCGCCHLADRAAYLALGGYNAAWHDYGFHEYEFAARWMLAHGPEAIVSANTMIQMHPTSVPREKRPGADHPQVQELMRLYGRCIAAHGEEAIHAS